MLCAVLLTLAVLLLLLALRAQAEGIHIKSAELIPTEAGYALEANYDITLTHTLEEALMRGAGADLRHRVRADLPALVDASTCGTAPSPSSARSTGCPTTPSRANTALSFGALNQNFDTLEEALARDRAACATRPPCAPRRSTPARLHRGAAPAPGHLPAAQAAADRRARLERLEPVVRLVPLDLPASDPSRSARCATRCCRGA